MEQDKKTAYAYDKKKQTEIGVVKIADEVVGMIAAYAALEVDGCAALAGGITADQLGKGTKKAGKSIHIEISKAGVRADLSVVMNYGFNIPATSGMIQRKVRSEIENMTGLNVTDVNIRIAGIEMPLEV